MTISPNLLIKVREQYARLTDRSVSQVLIDDLAVKRLSGEITVAVPFLIADAQVKGREYAEVMILKDGEDYSCPTWQDRVHSKSPRAEWLHKVAASVFAYCDEYGLNPSLSAFSGPDRTDSHMIIHWSAAALDGTILEGADPAYLERIRQSTAAGQARQAAREARNRARDAKLTIEAMHSSISQAASRGISEVTVFSVHSRSHMLDLRSNSWTGDVIQYCEQLGLTIRIDRDKYVADRPMCYTLVVSWVPGTAVRKPGDTAASV